MECSLENKHCVPCEGGVQPLDETSSRDYLQKLAAGWELLPNHSEIMRRFDFKNYYQTIAFVNAIAWMAHRENHHPDLTVSFNHCVVRYTTHAIRGLSENDFICATKVDTIYEEGKK